MTRERKSTKSTLSDLSGAICKQLARNKRVRRKLPEYGRVHIDRQLPFLVVYRQPPERSDPGTERLLLGEASYMLFSGNRQAHTELVALLKEVVRTQTQAFGTFLILEVWSATDDSDYVQRGLAPGQPGFTISAPEHNAPDQLLEQLENALVDIAIDHQPSEVALIYADDWSPPGLHRLLTEHEMHALGCTLLGLKVRPVYRDSKTAVLFPFELRALQQALGHALKHAFYTFAHAYTTQRPAHYHELGRRAETSAVWETDRRLAAIGNSFDILLHVTPTNAEAAFAEFSDSGFEHTPEFRYRPRPIDPALLKRQLYQIPLERIEDPALEFIFDAKRDEIDRQLTLITDRGTSRFLPVCISIYGKPEDWLLTLAQDILIRLAQENPTPTAGPLMYAGEFAKQAEAMLEHYREQYPELPACVQVRPDLAEILVSHGHLLISEHYRTPASRAMGTIAHEIGTHIVTYYNGRAQPFQQLSIGMAHFEALQEGLAVLAEYLVGELDQERMRLLAARVIAADSVVRGASFIETFRELHAQHGLPDKQAFITTMRTHRGGGYIKDIVYLRGLVQLLDYLKLGGDLELLYLGKMAMEHLPLVEELRWRQVLGPSLLRPHYLDIPEAKKRLQQLTKGFSVLDLLSTLE